MNKPIKVTAGRYTYRGVSIAKLGNSGFCATVYCKHGWYRIGGYTLAKCVKQAEELLNDGYIVRHFNLYEPAHHANLFGSN